MSSLVLTDNTLSAIIQILSQLISPTDRNLPLSFHTGPHPQPQICYSAWMPSPNKTRLKGKVGITSNIQTVAEDILSREALVCRAREICL